MPAGFVEGGYELQLLWIRRIDPITRHPMHDQASPDTPGCALWMNGLGFAMRWLLRPELIPYRGRGVCRFGGGAKLRHLKHVTDDVDLHVHRFDRQRDRLAGAA
jgi:hypothetical protein